MKTLTDQVVDALTRRLPGGGSVHIEDIQDQVELSLMRAGEHVVAQKTHYVGTMKALEDWLPRYGIEVTLVDQTDVQAFETALRSQTRLIFLETPTNPTI